MRTCAECGQRITVFVGEPAGLDWTFRPFCDACRKQILPGAACPECTTTFADFLERGFLGCETCYTVHARRLLPLLETARPTLRAGSGSPAVVGPRIPPTVSRMARVRTDETRALVLEGGPDFDQAAMQDIPGVSFDGRVYRSPSPFYSDTQTSGDDTGPAPRGEQVIRSVRLRVARNLVGLPYLSRPERARRLAAVLLAPGSILSRRRAAALSSSPDAPAARVNFLVGDEDHLRLEWIFPFTDEAALGAGMQALAAEIAELDGLYCWQEHRDFGMLAACPANSGSGVRLSFRVALPGLLNSGRWNAWRRELEQAGLEVRGPAGEGSRPAVESGVLQISNRFLPAGIDLSQESVEIFAILRRLSSQERDLF